MKVKKKLLKFVECVNSEKRGKEWKKINVSEQLLEL